MKSIITYDNLSCFAYSNDKICQKPIKGIVLSFFGLGGCSMFAEESPEGIFYAEQGMLYVVPYNNPWNWMNRQAVNYTDEILDVLFARYRLDSGIPIVSTGGSMGGLSALVYACHAKRTPVSCVANCPVCDLVFHYSERHDLPRTLYSAFYHEGESLEEALKTASPLHLIPQMPRISYHIFHCDQDGAVNITRHSETFVSAMRAQGHRVTYDIAPNRDHCDLTEEMNQRFLQYITTAIEDANH